MGAPEPIHAAGLYHGIPYRDNGRDRSGIDCWGLVRLWLKEQRGIELPSFADRYAGGKDPALDELIAREQEGWARQLSPDVGDVVLFRILGQHWHLGVVVAPGKFLHAREGQDSVVDRLDSPRWRHRIRGYFRYVPGASATVSDVAGVELHACPHPLMTQRIDALIPPGITLREVDAMMRAAVTTQFERRAVIMVDGMAIAEQHWDAICTLPGQRIEYRAVPMGDGTGRLILTLAVMAAATIIAPYITPTAWGAIGVKLVGAGISMAGMLLVNALFPVRPPGDPGQAEQQNLLLGGQNRAAPYQAIPIVLGRFRYSPPLGAQSYVEADADTSYLRMVLVWGYGPLQVSDLRIGATSIENFEEVELETLTGWDDSTEDKTHFNSLYGSDVTQDQPGVELECIKREVDTATRATNVVTVVTTEAHGYSVGWEVKLLGGVSGEISEVVNATTFKFPSTGADGPIEVFEDSLPEWNDTTGEWETHTVAATIYAEASAWTERTLADEADKITVTLHFPEGLRKVSTTGKESGSVSPALFRAKVQVRQLDPDTLAPLTAWGNIEKLFAAKTINLKPAWFNVDSDAQLEKVYRWARLSLDEHCKLIVRYGAFTTDPNADPTAGLLARQQEAAFGVGQTYTRLPAYGASEEPLYDICVYGSTVYSTVDRRDASITGCGLSLSGLAATIAAGEVTRAEAETVRLGGVGEPFCRRKDAFTYNLAFNVTRGRYEVRVRRVNDSATDFTFPSGNTGVKMHACQYLAVTGYRNAKPIVEPKNVKLAMTAIRIKATNQVNGNLDGVSGTVQSICWDYDHTTSTWIKRATRNPASLFRYVLQHPGNAKKVADSGIDLDALADWHTYCRTNQFMFDAVVSAQRTVDDLLDDIAAAGRASKRKADGKWTVVIDRVNSTIAQTFTPHNSWGFEGTRMLPRLPHAFRVNFNNAAKGYQPDEMLVYNDGYTSANATLFEALSLPGVTTSTAVFKHARMHYAQLKLRPETYTLNADIENLVCTRGDRVKVNHDVPMWGLGSGRIKNYVSSTELELDEAVTMAAGTQYTIGIRLEDGSRITRTVAAKVSAGDYTTITLTASITATEGKAGNLFTFGELGEESVDCLVLGIEHTGNLTARLTLVDYAPAVFDSDSEVVPDFDSQITLPPTKFQRVVTQSPTVRQITSDETVMELLANGQYAYRIKVAYSNPKTLPDTVTHIEGQIDFVEDGALDWSSTRLFPVGGRAVMFEDVAAGSSYKMRLRYVDRYGNCGPWVLTGKHRVVGKSTQPKAVGTVDAVVEGSQIRLTWPANTEVDIVGYEVRTSDDAWGNGSHLWRGNVLTCLVDPPALGATGTWYVKALDAAGLYSATASSASYTYSAVPNVAAITATFQDTNTTNATVTLDWEDVAPAFGLKSYRVSYGGTVKNVAASTITLPANWLGDRSFTVQTRDLRGNLSTGTVETVTKLKPGSPENLRAQVIDNQIMLYWDVPAVTTLPISHTLIKVGDTWAGATVVGRKDGAFTTISVLAGGTYKYWAVTVDTDGYESDPVTVSVQASDPQDFVFHASQDSDFTGTFSSSLLEGGAVTLPINTTETWAEHFTNNSWSTPQDQIDAGYPIYAQPTPASGSYTETFDLGTVLASSQVTMAYGGTTIAGAPVLSPKIELSDDALAWTEYDGQTSVFGTAFRYVRFTLTLTSTAGDDLYRLETLNCLVNAKLKNDAGTTACVSTDASGTVANFNKEYIDVTSITVTPNSTDPVVAVYHFKDEVLTGTYSIASGVLTASITAHDLVVGQAVRLTFTSGGADGQTVVATVASVTDANTFTASTALADASGNLSIYPQGARIYLFNSTTGARVSADAGWNIKGY